MSVIDSTTDASKRGVGDRRKLTLPPFAPPCTSRNLRAGINHPFRPIPLDVCVLISLFKSAVAVSNSPL